MKKLITILLSVSNLGALATVPSQVKSGNNINHIPVMVENNKIMESENEQDCFQPTGADGSGILETRSNIVEHPEHLQIDNEGTTDLSYFMQNNKYGNDVLSTILDFDLVPTLFFVGANLQERDDLKIHVHFDANEKTKEIDISNAYDFDGPNLIVTLVGKLTFVRDVENQSFKVDYKYTISKEEATRWTDSSKHAYDLGWVDLIVANSKQYVNPNEYKGGIPVDKSDGENKISREEIELYRGWTPATTYSNTGQMKGDPLWFNKLRKTTNPKHFGQDTAITGITQEDIDSKKSTVDTRFVISNSTFTWDEDSSVVEKNVRFNVKDYDDLSPDYMRVVAMPTVDQQIRYIEALLNDGRADNRFTVNFDSRNFPEYLVYLEEFITSRFGTNENLPIKIEMEMKDNLLNRKKQLIVYINANNSRAALHSTMYQMDRKLDYSDIVNHDVNFIEETNDIKFTDHDDYKKVDVTKKVEPIVTKDQIYAVDDKHIIFKAQGAGDLIGLNIFPTGKPSSKGIKKIKIENDVIDVTLNDSISDSQSITIEAMNMNKTLVVSCKLDSNHNYTEPETSVNELELTVGEWQKVFFKNSQNYSIDDVENNDGLFDLMFVDSVLYVRANKSFDKTTFAIGNKKQNTHINLTLSAKKNKSSVKLDQDLSKLDLSQSNTVHISNFTYYNKIKLINNSSNDYEIRLYDKRTITIEKLRADAPENFSFKIVTEGSTENIFDSTDLSGSYVDDTDYSIPEEFRNPDPVEPTPDPVDPVEPNNNSDTVVIEQKSSNTKWIVPLTLLSLFGTGWFVNSMIQMKRMHKRNDSNPSDAQ